MKQFKIIFSMMFVCALAACSDSGTAENQDEVVDAEMDESNPFYGYKKAMDDAKGAEQLMQKHQDDQKKDLSGI